MYRLMPPDDADTLDKRTLHGLQLTFDHLPVGVGVFTLTGKAIYLNRPFIELHHLHQWTDAASAGDIDFNQLLEQGIFRDWKVDPVQHMADMLATITRGEPYEVEIEQGDRIIRVRSRLMAGDYLLSTQEDVTARVRAERQVTYLAHHDPLTHLLNRTGFAKRLAEILARKQATNEPFGIISLDLDHFKDVNDLHGHMAGDAVLRAIGTRLAALLQPEDFAGRLGGDEFILVIGSDQQPSSVNLMASRLQAELCRPVAFEGRDLTVGTSIGIALFPRDGEDQASLISNADMALYRAKREGRGRACVFDPIMDEHAHQRRQSDRQRHQDEGLGEGLGEAVSA